MSVEAKKPEHRTVFSPAELREVETTWRQALTSLPADRTLAVEGALTDDHVWLRGRVTNRDRSEVVVVEAATAVAANDAADLLAGRVSVVEYLFVMLEELLEADLWPRPPLDWTEFDYEGRTMRFRGSVMNEAVEDMAEAWLRDHGEAE